MKPGGLRNSRMLQNRGFTTFLKLPTLSRRIPLTKQSFWSVLYVCYFGFISYWCCFLSLSAKKDLKWHTQYELKCVSIRRTRARTVGAALVYCFCKLAATTNTHVWLCFGFVLSLQADDTVAKCSQFSFFEEYTLNRPYNVPHTLIHLWYPI